MRARHLPETARLHCGKAASRNRVEPDGPFASSPVDACRYSLGESRLVSIGPRIGARWRPAEQWHHMIHELLPSTHQALCLVDEPAALLRRLRYPCPWAAS